MGCAYGCVEVGVCVCVWSLESGCLCGAMSPSVRGYWVAVGLLYPDCGEQAVRFEGDICCSRTLGTHSLDI